MATTSAEIEPGLRAPWCRRADRAASRADVRAPHLAANRRAARRRRVLLAVDLPAHGDSAGSPCDLADGGGPGPPPGREPGHRGPGGRRAFDVRRAGDDLRGLLSRSGHRHRRLTGEPAVRSPSWSGASRRRCAARASRRRSRCSSAAWASTAFPNRCEPRARGAGGPPGRRRGLLGRAAATRTPSELQARVEKVAAGSTYRASPCSASGSRPASGTTSAGWCPRAQLEEWPGGGHFVHLAEADRFTARLRAFVDFCGGARP